MLDSSVQMGILPDPGHQDAAASNAALRIQSCFRRILAKRRVDTLRMVKMMKAIADQFEAFKEDLQHAITGACSVAVSAACANTDPA